MKHRMLNSLKVNVTDPLSFKKETYCLVEKHIKGDIAS